MDLHKYYSSKCIGWCDDNFHQYIIEADLSYLRVMRSFGEVVTLEHLCNLSDMVCAFSEFNKKFCSVNFFLN